MTRTRPIPSVDNPIAVGLDVDGTLASGFTVSDYTVDILSKLDAVGVKCFLVTGRAEASVENTYQRANLSNPYVACNGALVIDASTGERLLEQRMDFPFTQSIYEYCKGKPLIPTIFTADAIYCDAGWVVDVLETINNIKPIVVPWDEVPLEEALKVMIGMEEELMAEYLPEINRLFPRMQQTMPTHVEACPVNASKGTSVPIVLDRMGIPASRCIGFGDADNDIEWLANSGWVVVPENASPAVKSLADENIGPNTSDSVAKYLAETFLN